MFTKILSFRKQAHLLCIMDGYALNPEIRGNAVVQARTPNLHYLFNTFPTTILGASSEDVGLPPDTMGNSEVGHVNMGAGRIVLQSLLRINKAIEDESFKANPAILKAIEHAKKNDSALHLLGMLSDAGVHSHDAHLYALLDLAREHGIKKVFVHPIMDGRDTSEDSGIRYLKKLDSYLKEAGTGQVATVMGRAWAMDRDKDYGLRTQTAYRGYTEGAGEAITDPVSALEQSYSKGTEGMDEYVAPMIVVDDENQPIGTVKDNDAIIFFNFRPDRAKQLTYAFTDPGFSEFQRTQLKNIVFVKMAKYAENLMDDCVAYPPDFIPQTLGDIISKAGLSQLRIAETEKYAHVTHFFSGQTDNIFPGEDQVLIPSDASLKQQYQKKPEMSAPEVTDKLIPLLNSGKYDLIVLNFANCDMVGHRGFMEPAVKAVEVVDQQIGRIVPHILAGGHVMYITADHGNADTMIGPGGKKITKHSKNPVPFILVSPDKNHQSLQLKHGRLADIAPTILKIMGLKQPEVMTGQSLIKED